MDHVTHANGSESPKLIDIKQMELEMLRQFYGAWVGLHTLPREDSDAMEQAAQYLMECAHVVREFKRGKLQ